MSKAVLLAALAPVLDVLAGLSEGSPAQGRATLEKLVPLSSLTTLKALVRQGVAEGWLCDKVVPASATTAEVRFSRVLKSSAPSAVSVDAVHMSGAGAGHTHPGGEFDLCFAVQGDPRFDGNPEGWTVYAPGTWHVPTVTGGVMDILYFLPGGQIRFEAAPSTQS